MNLHFPTGQILDGLNLNPIPLEFSQSLTTSEFLLVMQRKLTEIVDFLQEFQEALNKDIDENKNYLETEVITRVERDLEEYKETVNKTIETLQTGNTQDIENNLAYMRELLEQTKNDLKNSDEIAYASMLAYVNEKDEEIRQLIKAVNVVVRNPINGLFEDIAKVLTDIYDAIRTGALTASQFDAIGITAKQFDDLNINAYQFDVMGNQYIGI